MADFGVCVHMEEVGSHVGTGSVLLLEGADVNVAELVQERRCGKKWRVWPHGEEDEN